LNFYIRRDFKNNRRQLYQFDITAVSYVF